MYQLFRTPKSNFQAAAILETHTECLRFQLLQLHCQLFSLSLLLPFSSRWKGHQRVLRGSDHNLEDQLLSCSLLRLHRHRFGAQRPSQRSPVSRLHQQQHLPHSTSVQHQPQHSGGLRQQSGGKEYSCTEHGFILINNQLHHVVYWLWRRAKWLADVSLCRSAQPTGPLPMGTCLLYKLGIYQATSTPLTHRL